MRFQLHTKNNELQLQSTIEIINCQQSIFNGVFFHFDENFIKMR